MKRDKDVKAAFRRRLWKINLHEQWLRRLEETWSRTLLWRFAATKVGRQQEDDHSQRFTVRSKVSSITKCSRNRRRVVARSFPETDCKREVSDAWYTFSRILHGEREIGDDCSRHCLLMGFLTLSFSFQSFTKSSTKRGLDQFHAAWVHDDNSTIFSIISRVDVRKPRMKKGEGLLMNE